MSGRDTPGVSGAGQTPVGESRQAAGRFHCRTSAPGRAIVGDEGGCPLRGALPLGERSKSILSRTYRPAVGASEDAPSVAVGGTVPEGLAPDCPARRRSGDRLAFGNPRSPARVGDPEEGEEPGRFIAPHGIAVDSHGDIYVGEVSYTIRGSKMDPPRELRSFSKYQHV